MKRPRRKHSNRISAARLPQPEMDSGAPLTDPDILSSIYKELNLSEESPSKYLEGGPKVQNSSTEEAPRGGVEKRIFKAQEEAISDPTADPENDITIIVQDEDGVEKKIACDKRILASRSTYFKAMFSNTAFIESNMDEVRLKDVNADIFEKVREFAYTGRYSPYDDLVLDAHMCAAAEYLCMDELCDLAFAKIKAAIDITSSPATIEKYRNKKWDLKLLAEKAEEVIEALDVLYEGVASTARRDDPALLEGIAKRWPELYKHTAAFDLLDHHCDLKVRMLPIHVKMIKTRQVTFCPRCDIFTKRVARCQLCHKDAGDFDEWKLKWGMKGCSGVLGQPFFKQACPQQGQYNIRCGLCDGNASFTFPRIKTDDGHLQVYSIRDGVGNYHRHLPPGWKLKEAKGGNK